MLLPTLSCMWAVLDTSVPLPHRTKWPQRASPCWASPSRRGGMKAAATQAPFSTFTTRKRCSTASRLRTPVPPRGTETRGPGPHAALGRSATGRRPVPGPQCFPAGSQPGSRFLNTALSGTPGTAERAEIYLKEKRQNPLHRVAQTRGRTTAPRAWCWVGSLGVWGGIGGQLLPVRGVAQPLVGGSGALNLLWLLEELSRGPKPTGVEAAGGDVGITVRVSRGRRGALGVN